MYSNFNSEFASFMSAIMGFVVVFTIIALAVSVLVIVAMWKMFEKAGEPGWASLIPFYNSYVLFKISWGNGWFFLLSIVPSFLYQMVNFGYITNIIRAIINGGMNGNFNNAYIASFASRAVLSGFLMFILWAGMLAVHIILCIKLAKVFGQGGGFACGLFFLGAIFYCIIAFSKDIHYVGIPGKTAPYGAGANYAPNGYRQQGYQNPYYQPNTQQYWQNPYAPQGGYQAPSSEEKAFCPECGTSLNKDDMFCTNCGTPRQKQ